MMMGEGADAPRGTQPARWGRVLLKLSGEAFAGPLEFGIDGATVRAIAEDVAAARNEFDVDIAVVVGGGNIWRGSRARGPAWTGPRPITWACWPPS
ncbi:MAG: hypothetical protein R2695_11990 [Acidimicrobiales bacterium]